jgi:hypothetical protein
MNPLRKERKENNSGSPRATYDQVFGRPGFLSRFSRPALTPPIPCAPQLYEPYIDNHYVAFHRKKGPIGYVGVYRGKHNCLYRFNYINDHDYNGNKYLFKQVPPRNAIPGSNINNSMKERFFSIYEKDGTKINTFIFLARRKNILLFEAEDFSTFRCEINEYNYELDLDDNREIMERLEEIKERERRSEREMEREKDSEEKRKQSIKEEQPSSNNGSNHSRTKRKIKTRKVLEKLRTKGINLNALNNVTSQRILKRATNYENAGSSESSPNYHSMIPKELSKLEIPPMIRLNSEASPLTAAASYSLERAGVYPDIPNYGAKLQTKRNEIRRRAEYLNMNRGSSNDRNDLRRTNSKRTLKAKELMRKTIKKLLPRVRSRLKARS